MEGKGWFVIYGVLLLAVIGLVVWNVSLGNRIAALEQAGPTPAASETPAPESTESSEPEPTPDLSTPEKRDAVRKASLAETREALEKFQDEKGTYPTTREELVPDFLEAVPADPLTPKYTFRYARTNTGFQLTAALESKTDPDDAKDGKKDQVYTLNQASPR